MYLHIISWVYLEVIHSVRDRLLFLEIRNIFTTDNFCSSVFLMPPCPECKSPGQHISTLLEGPCASALNPHSPNHWLCLLSLCKQVSIQGICINTWAHILLALYSRSWKKQHRKHLFTQHENATWGVRAQSLHLAVNNTAVRQQVNISEGALPASNRKHAAQNDIPLFNP